MSLSDPTQQVLEAAMRGAWQRQTALTNNIANADTPGYGREEVNFESALQSAISGGEAPEGLQFTTETQAPVDGPNGNGVDIDQESALLAQNGLDYQAITQVMNTRNEILRTAMGLS